MSGLGLDSIAFQNDLCADVSGMKSAFMYYSAQRDAYLSHMALLSDALNTNLSEWDAQVAPISESIMKEFLVDIHSLLPSFSMRLPTVSEDPADFHSSSSFYKSNWLSALHVLENEALTYPRSEDTFVRWLNACLHAKLFEEMQSIRRAVLGYLWTKYLLDAQITLGQVIGVNVESFGWRLSEYVNKVVIPEKVDPRTGRRISWPATKTDHRTLESHPMFGRKIAEHPFGNLGRTYRILIDAVVWNKPVRAFRRFYTCPRHDVFDKVSGYFEKKDFRPKENVRRAFCKFCFMHAFTEAIRHIPKFFFVNKFEHIPYHGVNSQCIFIWEYKLLPLGLLNIDEDVARSEYIHRITQVLPSINKAHSINDLKVDLMRTCWDRSWLE